ncbi:MAG: hypothetical protein FJ100_23445 [Deltaproteobacteria bacterium]|nr:hypothetical protein [Deltaproteobacteria bacterium]
MAVRRGRGARPMAGLARAATWACRALAKLGGWMPKKGASPGYAKLWRGWDKLSERVEAVQLAFGLPGQEM